MAFGSETIDFLSKLGVLVHNAAAAGCSSDGFVQGDHVFNKGLAKSLTEFAGTLRDLNAWPELSETLESAAEELKAEPFGLTVNKGASPLGGDANSIEFGKAVQNVRDELQTFFDAANFLEGCEVAALHPFGVGHPFRVVS